LLIISGCSRDTANTQEIKDNDITLQLNEINHNGDSGVFRVRLIPSLHVLKDISVQTRESLMYRMDSCFYLTKGNEKIYPVLVQAIANGSDKNFEYILDFNDAEKQAPQTQIYFVNKYLNKRSYHFTLKAQHQRL